MKKKKESPQEYERRCEESRLEVPHLSLKARFASLWLRYDHGDRSFKLYRENSEHTFRDSEDLYTPYNLVACFPKAARADLAIFLEVAGKGYFNHYYRGFAQSLDPSNRL